MDTNNIVNINEEYRKKQNYEEKNVFSNTLKSLHDIIYDSNKLNVICFSSVINNDISRELIDLLNSKINRHFKSSRV